MEMPLERLNAEYVQKQIPLPDFEIFSASKCLHQHSINGPELSVKDKQLREMLYDK